MADKKINCHQSFDYGMTAARKEALKKQIELHFDAMKQHYSDMLKEINDDQIIETMFDSPVFFRNERSRDSLNSVMKSIEENEK